MKYAYEDLSARGFEELVIAIARKVLGISVQGFAEGPDGGRDAKFEGTAELHPSKSAPWIGKTIIQAKHTNGINRLFSESDFFAKGTKLKNCIIGKEIPRIKKLKEGKHLDHYMLFANRKLGGNTESDIKLTISKNTSLPESSIYLCDVEQIERYLNVFKDISEQIDLDPIDSPLIISPDDLAEIITNFSENIARLVDVFNYPPTQRTSYKEKNILNSMTEEYASRQLKKYLRDVHQIEQFLAHPDNLDLLALYQDTAHDFASKITSKRKDFQTFDEIIEYLVDLLQKRNPTLRERAHKPLVRMMLFFMYWNCDIGENVNDTPEQRFASR